jgi:GNAT superfamily N-acetyltransferase
MRDIEDHILAAWVSASKQSYNRATSILSAILNYYEDESAIVAWRKGYLVGIALYNMSNNRVHILEFASVEQNIGIGTSIMKEIIMMCEEHHIHHISLFSNEGAEGFYYKLGFTKDIVDVGMNAMVRII